MKPFRSQAYADTVNKFAGMLCKKKRSNTAQQTATGSTLVKRQMFLKPIQKSDILAEYPWICHAMQTLCQLF